MVWHLPSWSLSEPFCSTSWSMAVYSSSSSHILLLAVLQQWSLILLSVWLVWHISSYCRSSKSPKQGSCWRVDVLVCEDSGYLLKYGCEGNTLLWRRSSTSTCSRVARFDDIFDFGLWMYHFHFVESSTLVLSVNSPNATSLHSRCIWEGVLRV